MIATLGASVGGMLLKEFAPDVVESVAGWFTDDDEAAKQIAGVAADTAKKLTGASDAETAAKQIRDNPELALKFEREATRKVMALAKEETRRLKTINQTMRAEIASSDPYVRRWRPYIGYIVGTGLGLMFLSVFLCVGGAIYVGVWGDGGADTIAALYDGLGKLISASTAIVSVALGVLGVNIVQRSKDKKVAAGQGDGPGLIGAVAERIRSGGQ